MLRAKDRKERGVPDSRLDVRTLLLEQHVKLARPVACHALGGLAYLLEAHDAVPAETDARDGAAERLEVVDVGRDRAAGGEVQEVEDEVVGGRGRW